MRRPGWELVFQPWIPLGAPQRIGGNDCLARGSLGQSSNIEFGTAGTGRDSKASFASRRPAGATMHQCRSALPERFPNRGDSDGK